MGSGRFAEKLGIDVGVDPALTPLRLARRRGVEVVRGRGERLPLRDSSVGAVVMIVTLCFVENPSRALLEAARVLKTGGGLITGLVLKDSRWGRFYLKEKEGGHPFYRAARFLTSAELINLIERAGLYPVEWASTISRPPGRDSYEVENPAAGLDLKRGFHCLLAIK